MKQRTHQDGQALIMLTLGLVSMFGLMGLAVDVGWMYFVRRSAQAAADAAALAAAREALRVVGQTGTPNCATNVECAGTPTACSGSFSGSLAAACTYAQTNGYRHAGRQRVTVAAGVVTNPAGCLPNCIPTATGVAPIYWATVRIAEDVPQLFSAVMGKPLASTAARATAAIVGIGVDDSIIVINRENDPSPVVGVGSNIYIQGGGGIVVPGGIRMASNANGPGTGYAGYTGGSGTVTAGTYTRIRGNPAGPLTGVNDVTKWTPAPINKTDSQVFRDPYEAKGQPAIGNTVLPNCPVLNGVLPANALLGPGNYYAVNNAGQPTGAPLSVGGSNAGVRFTATNSGTAIDYSGGRATGGTCKAGVASAGTSFGGDHILYGGVDLSGNGGTMTVEPGRYVMAGTKYSGNPNNISLMNLGQNGSIVDLITGSTPSASDPGTLFILTNANYQGLSTQLATIPALNAIKSQLEFAPANLQGGTNSTGIRLHGLNDQNASTQAVGDANSMGSKLTDFGTLAFWQDQANSTVVYDSTGRITGPINNPTTRTLTRSNSPEFFYQGSANSILWGTIYQPRGAWMRIQGGGQSAGNNRTRIVTGALRLGGSSTIQFGNLASAITVRVASLVE